MPNLYGIIISLSILLCILTAQRLVENENKNKEILWGLSFWTILCGILGARIYHVLNCFGYYRLHPAEILKIWRGGLGIWGALGGGIVGSVTYLGIKKEKVLPWLDIISVVVPLGQAIGRWGNFFNKELSGLPTTLPWGIYVEPTLRPAEFSNYSKFHPIFIYESILNLILFLILLNLYKNKHEKVPEGTFLWIYLGSYSIIRFFLEFLRINPWKINIFSLSLNVSQCVSILVLMGSMVVMLRRKSPRKNK